MAAADLLTKQWAERALADGDIAVAGAVGLSLGYNSGVAVSVLVASARGQLASGAGGLLVGGAVGNLRSRRSGPASPLGRARG